MGREIRRVPLDFDWPEGKVWDGFLNPHYRSCPHCEAGWSRSYHIVKRHIAPLVWDRDGETDPRVVQIVTFLCEREPRDPPFSRDSIDSSHATTRLGLLAGLPEKWDTCPECGGSGIDPEARVAYEAWERTPPPEGEGWQVWETVSEGSPASPVFPTAEALEDYLVNTKGHTREAARNFVRVGWVPSGLIIDGAYLPGIDAAAMMPGNDNA